MDQLLAWNAKGSRRRIIISRFTAVGLLVLLCVSVNGWSHISPAFEECLALLGWVFVGIGVMGRIWSGSYICGRKTQFLVIEGPYSMCRNPLYLFSFIAGLGVMLVTETLTLPLIFTTLFLSYYHFAIRHEEDKLRDLHGAAFDEYKQRVPRFWPRWQMAPEPSTNVVNARSFRSLLLDAMWFVLAAGLIDFMEQMHIQNHLPTLFTIY